MTMEPNPTRLRQIALVAKDLEKARQLLTKVIGTEVIYEDPLVAQWGLKNLLVAIGGDIIEVVSPFQPNTTAGRLLERRGDGGYMIIMQTLDALARRKHIEDNSLAKVIFGHEVEGGDSVCVQYHPKGVRGGVIPELDSHKPSLSNPNPINAPFPPWHACGPATNYDTYSAGMRRNGDLHLVEATLRLKPGEFDVEDAAEQWEKTFGVKRSGAESRFMNATMGFVKGEADQPDGITNITIAVEGKRRLEEIYWRAKFEGVKVDSHGFVEMLGIKWKFVLFDQPKAFESKL